MSILNPYLNFVDNARDAITFYQSALGGELTISTFGENGMAGDAADINKVMHAQLTTPAGFTLMASDIPPGMEHSTGSAISISLSGTDEAELRGYWDRLAVGGTPTMPLEKAPWGDTFGMLVDKFGIAWMVNITGSPQ
jgi:PhnB protein